MDSFLSNLEQLSCRRIIEENHSSSIIALLEEKNHDGICRYVATISKEQVNIYDNEDKNSNLGFFAHYAVQQTPYFKGGSCTCGYWLYPQSDIPRDSILAVGTNEGEVFLLSCVDCYIISILSNRSSSSIVSITSSPSHSNLIIVLNQVGVLSIYDRLTSSRVFEYDSKKVRNAICDADILILEYSTGEFASLNLDTFSIASLSDVEAVPGIVGYVSLPSQSQWLIFTQWKWYSLDQRTLQLSSLCNVSLPSYVNQSCITLASDQSLVIVAEHAVVRVFLPTGEEIGMLCDNYAAGVQMSKEPSSYRKLPISGCVIHPKGEYAVMTENNRVMRFDRLDPNTRYVAHVKYPHPVEDMFIFYSSLNADPVIYLSPKVNTESKK